MSKTMNFPVLDFSKFTDGNGSERKECARKLVKQFEQHGFATLCNHGLSNDQVEDLFKWSNRFFELPLEKKLLSKHPPEAHPHRGYSRVGQENLSALNHNGEGEWKLSEVKELWDQGAPEDGHNGNQWGVDGELPGFRSFMEISFESLHDTAIKLLEAIALGLGLSQRYFEPFHTDRAHEFRLLHYPEIKVEDLSGETKTRTGKHTDFGSITLLFQDGIGGLEAEDQLNHDSFRPICAEWPIMIVNVGDSMQRWTNARLKSAQHRVTVPPSLKDKDGVVPERYSVAFFGKPNHDVSLLPIPELLKDAPSKYGDMTAGEYNRMRHLKVY